MRVDRVTVSEGQPKELRHERKTLVKRSDIRLIVNVSGLPECQDGRGFDRLPKKYSLILK